MFCLTDNGCLHTHNVEKEVFAATADDLFESRDIACWTKVLLHVHIELVLGVSTDIFAVKPVPFIVDEEPRPASAKR